MPLPLAGKRWSQLFTGASLTLGILVLVGWELDLDSLKRPLTGLVAMNPATAFCFITLAVSLSLLRSSQQAFHSAGYVLSVICIAIATLRLAEAASLISFQIDQVLFAASVKAETFNGRPCRMSVDGAINFLLLGISVICFKRSNKRISQGIAGITLLIAWLSVLGYLYRVPEFYGELPYLPMAIHAAFNFIFISMAVMLSAPAEGFAKEFFSRHQGSSQAWILFPFILLAPVLLGYLRLQAHWSGLISTEFGVAFLIISITVIMSVVAFIAVRNLNDRDQQQQKYQSDLLVANKDLQSKHEEIHTLNEEMTASNEELVSMNEQLQAAFDKIREQSDIIVKQKDEQLNRVLDSSRDAIWSIDLTGQGDNYISRSGEKLFGRAVTNEMINDPDFWTSRVHEDDLHIRKQSHQELREKGSAESVYRIRSSDNNYLWIRQQSRLVYDDAGKPVRYEGIISDITEYKGQEEVLNKYRENLDVIFSNTVEEILLLDNHGAILLFNQALENFVTETTGTRPEVGKYVWDITVPERREAVKKLFERTLSGERVTVDASTITPQREVHHEVHYEPVFIGGKVKYVSVISVDVTEKVKRENIIRQSEARLRAIFENAADAFTLLDRDYNVIMHNNALGEKPSQGVAEGVNIFDVMREDRREIFKDYLDRVAGGETVKYDVEYPNPPHAVWYHVTISGVRANEDLVGYCISTTDYTAIKRAEVSLKESEERFRALIENSKDIILLANTSLQIVYMNPAVKPITGFTLRDFLYQEIESFAHPDDRRNVDGFFAEVLENANRLYEITFRMRHKNGNWIWIEGTAMNLTEVRSVRGIVMNLRDVTTRKTYEEERSNLVAQLIEQNNDLTQFSFIASHNLRGPVASLLGLFNLIRDEGMSADNLQMISMAKRSVNNLDNVIRDLATTLEMRTHQLREKEMVNITDILSEIRQAIQMQVEESQAIIELDTDEVDSFFTVRNYFYSIVYNLVTNAIKYRSADRTPVIEIKTFINEAASGFHVKDNGIGIDLSQFRERIFGLYQRFHLASEGRGLGLYMVKTQVQLLNGKISIDSQPGTGTTFTITFPVQREVSEVKIDGEN